MLHVRASASVSGTSGPTERLVLGVKACRGGLGAVVWGARQRPWRPCWGGRQPGLAGPAPASLLALITSQALD